jgi:antitoxin (DNA-binding transcriptional repressor) of toxin-antitoxin stability system
VRFTPTPFAPPAHRRSSIQEAAAGAERVIAKAGEPKAKLGAQARARVQEPDREVLFSAAAARSACGGGGGEASRSASPSL